MRTDFAVPVKQAVRRKNKRSFKKPRGGTSSVRTARHPPPLSDGGRKSSDYPLLSAVQRFFRTRINSLQPGHRLSSPAFLGLFSLPAIHTQSLLAAGMPIATSILVFLNSLWSLPGALLNPPKTPVQTTGLAHTNSNPGDAVNPLPTSPPQASLSDRVFSLEQTVAQLITPGKSSGTQKTTTTNGLAYYGYGSSPTFTIVSASQVQSPTIYGSTTPGGNLTLYGSTNAINGNIYLNPISSGPVAYVNSAGIFFGNGSGLTSLSASSINNGKLSLSNGGTYADLGSTPQGALIYMANGQLGGSSSLTGIVIANGTNAPTALIGTTNYLPKWNSAASSLSLSSIFDNGNVGIGTSNPTSQFSIGSSLMSDN